MDIDLQARVYLVNIGVNSNNGTIKSPIFSDGTFEVMPRPEARSLWAPTLPAYPKMSSYNDSDEPLSNYVSNRYRNVRVMDDPEFKTFTYGANLEESRYRKRLLDCRPGDYLFFVALLSDYEDSFTLNESAFYIVGFIYIMDILPDIRVFPNGPEFVKFGHNAYIRRAVYHPKTLKGLSIWKGDPSLSKRLKYAVPFDKEFILENIPDHRRENWLNNDVDLRHISHYVRSARLIFEKKDSLSLHKKLSWWQNIGQNNLDINVPLN
jgi:hypothetical protein